MSEQKKKIIPKFKKKLQGFLSDESGKITKEDVLKMGIVAMGMATFIPTVDAAYHCSVGSSVASHANWGNTSWIATPVNSTASTWRWCRAVNDSMVWTAYVNSSVAPYSRLVNGHANGNATIQGWWFNGLNATIYQWQSHGSHASHGSHWQW